VKNALDLAALPGDNAAQSFARYGLKGPCASESLSDVFNL